MRITESEQEFRRSQMLHAAYTLFCEHGIDTVSLARIAKEANVSPNSIFRYFDSKAVLLEQTQDILWNEIVDCISNRNLTLMSDEMSGLAKIRILLYGFENLYKNHQNYVLFAYDYKAFLIRNAIKLPADEINRQMEPVRRLFMEVLDQGKVDGSIKTRRPSSHLFLYIWGVMRHFVEQIIVHSKIYDGENPWESMFPIIVDKIIADLELQDEPL